MEISNHFNDEYNVPRHLRKLRIDKRHKAGILYSAIFVLVVFGIKMFFLPSFSSRTLELLLASLRMDDVIDIAASNIWKYTYFLQMSVRIPDRIECAISALIAVCLMVIITRIKVIPKPVTILINLLLSPIATFAILFVCLPTWFSFDAYQMSDLTTAVSSLIMLGMPSLLWLFLAPVPIPLPRRIAYIAAFDVVICILYFMKHVVLIFIYRYTNVLVVPYVMLLVLSLWDVIWMNAVYSLIVSNASKKANNNSALWSRK